MSTFYARHSAASNPGIHAPLLQTVTATPAAVSQLSQGLVYHYVADEQFFGWKPPRERLGEIDTRQMKHMLARILELDSRPLTEARAYEKRLVGCCRDFSLLACAALREHGIPARLRYGFSTYFVPGYWIDHVMVEYWNGERWQRFDPELPASGGWSFDTLDMPDEVFVTGGRAWQMCRNEGADPARFGLGPAVPDVSGWWFVRGRLQLDIAALDKQELLCWDQWGFEGEALSGDDTALLDQAAALSLEADSDPLRALVAAETRLQVPDSVLCFSPAVGPHPVRLIER